MILLNKFNMVLQILYNNKNNKLSKLLKIIFQKIHNKCYNLIFNFTELENCLGKVHLEK